MNSAIDRSAIGKALIAAALFGAGTPIAKYLLGTVDPWLLAGLFYLGSGLGLSVFRLFSSGLYVRFSANDAGWLAGATLAGGIVAPVLLMFGLTHLPSSATALLLNAEGVLTALLAWFAFREHFNRRVALGMAFITLGAMTLSWPSGDAATSVWPMLAIVAACLAWAIDNNLTRKIALTDATTIASIKGMVAGVVNLALAIKLGAAMPTALDTGIAMTTGFATYGISLVLFVLALRGLGTARTAAYFAIAPFVGALIGLLSGDPVTMRLAMAAALMAFGIWLHLTEVHEHEHAHEPMQHTHRHSHDEHHLHDHDDSIAADMTHSHAHVHSGLRHRHPHFPDAHHRHDH